MTRLIGRFNTLADAVPPWAGLLVLAVVAAALLPVTDNRTLQLVEAVLAVLFVLGSASTFRHRVTHRNDGE